MAINSFTNDENPDIIQLMCLTAGSVDNTANALVNATYTRVMEQARLMTHRI